jgi:hypothetical protein
LLSTYGAEFPDFVSQSEFAGSHPELADLARLESLYLQAYHAADSEPLTPARWTEILAAPEHLPTLRFRLQASVSVLESAYPVVSIWASHQGLNDGEMVVPVAAQSAVIMREGLDVVVLPASTGMVRLLRALAAEVPLGAAAAQALEVDPEFDLASGLAYLIPHRLLSAELPPTEDCRP